MDTNLSIQLKPQTVLSLDFNGGNQLSLNMQTPVARAQTHDTSSINGVRLIGNRTSKDLHIINDENSEHWEDYGTYVPKFGEIIIYSDYDVIQDEFENDVYVPGIKVGDGTNYVADLPFVGDEIRYAILAELYNHEDNEIIHITQDERSSWNDKLNFEIQGEELIFTRN